MSWGSHPQPKTAATDAACWGSQRWSQSAMCLFPTEGSLQRNLQLCTELGLSGRTLSFAGSRGKNLNLHFAGFSNVLWDAKSHRLPCPRESGRRLRPSPVEPECSVRPATKDLIIQHFHKPVRLNLSLPPFSPSPACFLQAATPHPPVAYLFIRRALLAVPHFPLCTTAASPLPSSNSTFFFCFLITYR